MYKGVGDAYPETYSGTALLIDKVGPNLFVIETAAHVFVHINYDYFNLRWNHQEPISAYFYL